MLQHGAWLGPLLVAALLRQEGLAGNHLVSLTSRRQKHSAGAAASAQSRRSAAGLPRWNP
ncbi:DUF1612 domain-containing protein [Mesorhizobium helmanticense]|uniref:DUF1612 domain-containing protein n=1 Tax=Mesorhizobium helmanticense TaxID=1776423 RepID=UPI003CCA6775